MHLRDHSAGEEETTGKESQAENEVADSPSRNPQQSGEQRKEEERERDVILCPDDEHGSEPREEDGHEWTRIYEQTISKSRCRDREHFLVGCEIRGEVDAQQQLAALDWLDHERPGPDPETCSVDFSAEFRQQRCDEKDSAQKEEDIAVALEVLRAPYKEQGQQVDRDPQCSPDLLDLGIPRVPACDDDITDSVEEEYQREKHGLAFGTSHRFPRWTASANATKTTRKGQRSTGACGPSAKEAMALRSEIVITA